MKTSIFRFFISIGLLLSVSGCTSSKTSVNTVVGPVGPQGEQGLPGKDGKDGIDGKDGSDGKDGTDGQNGIDGNDGFSAYQIYIEYHPEYEGSEEQWLDDLINGRLGTKDTHTVSFDSDGGTLVSSQLVLHGEKAVRPSEPTKTGYVFSDWVDGNNDHWVFNGFSITEDTTLKAVWSETYAYSKIKINEICSKNRKSFIDKYGEDSDWIELYNSSNSAVNLEGCGLSNNPNDPFIFEFGDTIIEPEGYLVVAVSGRKTMVYDGEYHTPFTLSQKKGGTIVFSAPYGIVDSVTYPALKDDISFGRLDDELAMLKPSAGLNNEEIYVEKQILPAPVFSIASGIYDDEFDLTLSSEEGHHIYYTLDSATPNSTSTLYENPIHIYDKSNEEDILSQRTDICGNKTPYIPTLPVNKCMVVRAICYDDFGNYSPIVSSSYWIGQNDFIQSGIAVTSVSTDFDNLFDSEKGIYCRGKIWDDWAASEDYDESVNYYNQPANYHQKGFDWEREGNITFLNHKHNLKCEQSVGIRIKGSSTRGMAKKSLNLFSRYLYDGNSKFDYKFNDKKCEKITLRTGGNNLIYRDALNSKIALKYNLDFEAQDTTPTYVYLNGEFWGIYFITDAFDSRYIEEKYGIEDSIIYKAYEVEEGYQTDLEILNDSIGTIGKCILNDDGYSLFENAFSISSMVDTLIFQSYINHYDYSLFGWNIGYWRSREIESTLEKSDGRIRFMMYDTDMSLGNTLTVSDYPKIFTQIKDNSNYKYLFQSQTFVSQLCVRASEIIELLDSDECKQYVNDYVEEIDSLVRIDNYRYWGYESLGFINEARDTLLDFIDKRATYYTSFIDELQSVIN